MFRFNRLHYALLAAALSFFAADISRAIELDPVYHLTGKTSKKRFEEAARRFEGSTRELVRNPLKWLAERPEKWIAEVCAYPAQFANYAFEGQAGRWYSLPPDFIYDVQQFYSVDLRSVRYTENVVTVGKAAVTIGKRIYFPRMIDWTSRRDIHWVLHELEHVVQFRDRPRATRLCEYTVKVITHMSFEKNDWERAADRKANRVIRYIDWLFDTGQR